MDFSNLGEYSYDGKIWVAGKPIDLRFVCAESDTQPDAVHNPTHYTSGGIECWDAMQAAFGVDALKDFCKLNAFKYVWRADKKNGIEDISKAIVYLQKYTELSAQQTTDILDECIKTHYKYVAQCEKEAANESNENGTA